jgi:ATP-dependent DNA helicase RecQ
MIQAEKIEELKLQTLNHFWGHQQFRSQQSEIINTVLNQKDAIVLLPTGGGKSLCYQLPALLLEGTSIVVSPLLALMKDQVAQLKNRGIEAEYLSSELEDFDAETIYGRCKDGLTKLLYVSPERLTNSTFLQNIEEIKISFVAVDEAHCISEWGQDFRPSYQNIKEFKRNLKDIPCIALTATATPKVLTEISVKLALNNPKLFQQSFKRDNIRILTENISDKYHYVEQLLKYNAQSGIIYVRTRKEAEQLAEFLKRNNNQNVDFYHAALTTKEKNARQKKWSISNEYVLISTNAFGMGIDKDNVRFVIHFSPSSSIENYYQEIGRVGRDGQDSFAMMLWNEQEMKEFDEILKNQIPNKSEFEKTINFLYSLFQVADGEISERTFQFNSQTLRNLSKISFSKIYNILNFLHNQEIIYYSTTKKLSQIELLMKPEEIDLLAPKDSYFIELLLRNISGLTTHKTSFSELNICNKLGLDSSKFKERLLEMKSKGYIEYLDGEQHSVKFLQPRDSRFAKGKYWNLFEQIQKNKIQKWEEMKFYTNNTDYCKMRLILSYFGEKDSKNCEKCSYCEKQKISIFGSNISQEIIKTLNSKPATVEEIAIQLSYYQKEEILENLIQLLDSGKVKMLNFRTYALE